ncbi:hypothetical protein DL766_003396 [Monosporascus sp. MC13-8B]|uniref:Methyltransferase domain-containing protein n=1 Tax=Monosporascus cannonballus TaxID=155416 RepID=A0ABY0GXP4_9PEZI|nr:hypothetical protein DL762_009351 [Monosporascus cannonballus]RYO89073.1 hypothetical protein DL763_005783 [Monosporascus cannonballus]RYP33560.1 hypothetical protein DL766_003396 [Monosporascus sp. MC13-8B]
MAEDPTRSQTAETASETPAHVQSADSSEATSAGHRPSDAPITAGAPVIVGAPHQDNDADDFDSSLGDDISTASLSASILEYRTLHGRTYHSSKYETEYWGPNDGQHLEAMDINLKKVLDVGTGTGNYGDISSFSLLPLIRTLYIQDYGLYAHPGVEVIGTDLSPIQPAWCPPNMTFMIDDAEEEWTFAPNSFDFIYMRYLLGSIQDWPRLFKQAYAALKPGGYIESYESEPDFTSDDGTVKPDSALRKWTTLFTEAGRKLNRPFTVLSDDLQRKGIEEAGPLLAAGHWIQNYKKSGSILSSR